MISVLHNYITAQAERQPDAVAVVFEDVRLTYGQLEAQSNQIAWLLKGAGSRRGDRICLLATKSAAAIVAMLGIYKADCIYVPLDSSSPTPRLLKILSSCDPRGMLTAGQTAQQLDELLAGHGASVFVGSLDAEPASGSFVRPAFDGSDILRNRTDVLPYQNSGHDAAHILFTSGSTGTPKGVVITHGNVVSFVEWAIRYFGITSADRHSCHSPLHFDLSVFDIFGTLAAGATLFLVPPRLSLFPNRLADFIRTTELTQWFSVPSLLTYMANLGVVRFSDFPSLKRLLWCGEVLSMPTLIHWMQRLPHVSCTNLYGPTETTIASSYYTVPACPHSERDRLPIGTACDGETLHVLDADLHPVDPGTVGDLYIGGVGLSPGYWRNPEATRAAFVSNPLSADPRDRLYRAGDLASIGHDGLVYFHGRQDSQIKSRGHRIELGEIEATLNALSCLDECAVVAISSSSFEGTSICCAYVPGQGHQVTPSLLRILLSSTLPSYMLPSKWLALPKLPKNVNGKIDRPSLKAEFGTHEAAASAEKSLVP